MLCIFIACSIQKLVALEVIKVQSMCKGKHRPIQQNFSISMDLLLLAPLTDFVPNDRTQDK